MSIERIAIVADMHANIYAAEAFLRHLESIGGVDRILNLGDFVQIGPHPAEIADLALCDPRFVNVLGNNERSLTEHHPECFPPREAAHQGWTIRQLGPKRLERVAEMPASLTMTIGGIELTMAHEPPGELAGLTLHKQDLVMDSDGDPGVTWKLFGHTHRQACMRRSDVLCINPGSLGCSKDQVASFCIAEFGDQGVRLAFERISYDASRLGDDFVSRDVPDRDMLMSTFYGIWENTR